MYALLRFTCRLEALLTSEDSVVTEVVGHGSFFFKCIVQFLVAACHIFNGKRL